MAPRLKHDYEVLTESFYQLASTASRAEHANHRLRPVVSTWEL